MEQDRGPVFFRFAKALSALYPKEGRKAIAGCDAAGHAEIGRRQEGKIETER